MASEAQLKANKKYIEKTYTDIKLRIRKETRLKELLEAAADRKGISATQYIINAIQVQLNLDGISIEDLTEQEQKEG